MKGYVLQGKLVFGPASISPMSDGAVVTEGKRIAWVGPAAALPDHYKNVEYESISLPGRTIMPGLIDGHTHISFGEARSEEELALYTPVEFRTIKAIWNANKVLQAGVTSAFDAATTYNIAQSVRDAIDSGMYPGPRFAVSGKQLTSHQGLEDSFPNSVAFPEGQAGVLVSSTHDIVQRIRYQVKDGVDAIKVSGSNDSLISPDSLDGAAFTDDEFALIAKEAHRLGKLATVHARSRDAITLAAKAGFDVLFHASYIDDEGIEAALKAGSVICPTLPLITNFLAANAGKSGGLIDALEREYDAARINLPRAYRSGIPFVQGSESGWSPIPYGHWHAREAEIFVQEFGFTNLEAVECATHSATKMLKSFGNQVGMLEVGRLADLLVIDGDPVQDITLLQKSTKFNFIFKDGIPIDRTPVAPRQRMHYEKHKVFLAGLYEYDQAAGTGVLKA